MVVEENLPGDALPILKDDINISVFSDGVAGERYLVEVGEVCFVANKDMRSMLLALGERPETLEELAEVYERQTGQSVALEVLAEVVKSHLPDSIFSHTPQPKNQSPFIFSLKVVPRRFVSAVSSRLTWLYAKPVVALTLVAFLVSEYFVMSGSLRAIHHRFEGWELPLFYLMIVAATLFHELGHAAACRRYGCPHGDIGFAFYFIYPVFFTDVTKAWRLPPRRRAVVDVGGLYFQCLLIVGLTVYVVLTQSIFALRLIWAMHLTMLYTLNPILKMDGYWLLTDMSGLSNLHEQVGDTLRRWLKRLFLRPDADSAQVGGVRLTVLYLYIGLVLTYIAFIAHFLYRAVGDVIRFYPRQLTFILNLLQKNYASGNTRQALYTLYGLLYVSVWPLILCVLLVFMFFRVWRLFLKQPVELNLLWVRTFVMGLRTRLTRNA